MEHRKTAALIVIGNEILSGRTHDTNTPWIAERLLGKGIFIEEVRIIPDREEAIVEAVRTLREKVDYVLTTGGIGPTHDDITTSCVAKAFGARLERNEDAFRMLEEYYGLEHITPPRAKMAQIPAGARLIPNPVSAAPGFIMDNVYVMAGVPRIMQAMMDFVIEQLEPGTPVVSNTITCTLPESALAQELSDLQDRYADIEIGSYPHYRGGILGLSVVLRSVDLKQVECASEELVKIIRGKGDEPRAISLRASDDEAAE